MQSCDIAVIGGGTAGMTAALYAVRAGRQATVLEGLVCGGQIVSAARVENYPGILAVSGADFAAGLFEQASAAGARFDFQQARALRRTAGGFEVLTDGEPLSCKAVILAAGAKNRPLGLPGEEKFTGRGVSYCAACDGAFYKGKTAAVVGGGNTALDDALVLAELCGKVYLIHRRDEFRGERRTLEKAEAHPNIVILRSAVVAALEGEKRLSAVTVKNLKTGEEEKLPLDGLFIAVGQTPQNAPFADFVELDENGYIKAGEDCKTGTPGIFAAGDCRAKAVRQLATAAADGATAALAALEYLREI